MTTKVANQAKLTDQRHASGKVMLKDKKDRRTVDLVIDPRTCVILNKLANKQVFSRMEGCVSTGKEANVYYAFGPKEGGGQQELAIKIYKTSILVFKDRERYVVGDMRFKKGYTHNPR